MTPGKGENKTLESSRGQAGRQAGGQGNRETRRVRVLGVPRQQLDLCVLS